MEEHVFSAALAGLLHDIGKLEQRAREDPWNPAPGVEAEGQPVHATWSIYFIQNYVPAAYQAAALHGAYHHHPDQSPAADHSLSRLVALADKLSAGERADPPDRKKGLPQQLITIFDRVSLGESAKSSNWNYLPLRPLSLNQEALFPAPILLGGAQKDAYLALCEGLRPEVSRSFDDRTAYLENVLSALQRYTWCVPSAYYHALPDISLYDHSRMTAALAVCLADRTSADIASLLEAVQRQYQDQASEADRLLLQQPVALLVGGDISGVQDFIYTVSAKGAARSLRGRSFYLQLLTEAVLRFVLDRLGLPYNNVIYSGGCHFFLLAPPEAAEQLTSVRQEVTRILLQHHGPGLYLALDSAPVPADGFRIGEFPRYWGDMHAALALRKQRRYTELGEDFYPLIFEPPQKGGNPDDTCSVCGEDMRQVRPFDEEREEQARICSLCDSFIQEIGRHLPRATFLALGFGAPQETGPGPASNALRALGLSFQFLPDASQPVELPADLRLVLWALADPPGDKWPANDRQPAVHALRYTVNPVPLETFDQLESKTAGGFHRLGVLRMDVDDLGRVFKEGFGKASSPENRATLARLATLSLQVSLFFEGWIKRTCESGPYRDLIYSVYAGGDDVFLIGPWDRMPGLAQQISQEFQAYCGGSPDLHLSAGMAFIGGKYPIYQAAEDAHQALEKAKALPGKNAFSFLGRAWSWAEFEQVANQQARLEKLVGGEEGLEGPQAILQVLMRLAQVQESRAGKSPRRLIFGPWMWLGMYQLSRMAERAKEKPELASAILAIRDELNQNDYRTLHQWAAAARWTQLKLRKKL